MNLLLLQRVAKRPRRSPVAAIALLVAASVAVALVHVFIHLQVIQAGYDLAREHQLQHDLVEKNQQLRLELATRSDPEQVERRAREELHMTPPEPSAIRTLPTRFAVQEAH